MKKNILLLLIPICFIIYSIYLRKAEGPYYAGFSDPSYIYLINSLNLAQLSGYGVGHIDHPGTPVQIIGAVIIKIVHLIKHFKNTLVEDVIYRPEYYLTILNISSAILNSIGIFVFGLTIFKLSKNYFLSFTFQLIPFISINLLESFSEFKPENTAFFFIAVFLSIIIKFIFEENDFKVSSRYSIFLGVLIGIIISIKISFVSLAIIPLIIINKIKNKFIFIISSIVTFFICIIPALPNFEYIIIWVKNLLIYNQRYGKGNPTIIDFGLFINNFFKIIINEKIFMFSFVLIIIFLIYTLLFNNKQKEDKITKETKMLFSFFIAMVIQIFLVSKHYSSRYMYPVLILTVPSIYLAISIFLKKFNVKHNLNLIYGIFFGVMFLFSLNISYKLINRSIKNYDQVKKIEIFINQYNMDLKVISSSDVSNEFSGLVLSNFYSGTKSKNLYKEIIGKRFPNSIFFDVYNSQIFTFPDTLNLKAYLSGLNNNIIYQTKNENQNEKFILSLKSKINASDIKLNKIFSNNIGESLYEVKIK